MKNHSLILSFLAVLAGLFLAGTAYAEAALPAQEQPKADALSKQVQNQTNTIEVQKAQFKSKVKVTAAKQAIKASAAGRIEVTDSGIQNEDEALKPLDLSIPFQAIEDAGLKNEQNQGVQGNVSNLFSSEKNKRPLKLDGGFLMSQELEAEKQRSVDGAGIRLNLNP